VWVFALVLWFGVQFYVWPIFYAMERPTLAGAFRNAAVMAIRSPLFTLASWALAAVILVLSSLLLLAWLLLTGSLLAVLATVLVTDSLQAAGFAADARLERGAASEGGAVTDIYG
jgi:hypothetical protein